MCMLVMPRCMTRKYSHIYEYTVHQAQLFNGDGAVTNLEWALLTLGV